VSTEEIVLMIALAALVAYAYTRRPAPGAGFFLRRPMTAWEFVYDVGWAVLGIWLLRVAHVVYFGSN